MHHHERPFDEGLMPSAEPRLSWLVQPCTSINGFLLLLLLLILLLLLLILLLLLLLLILLLLLLLLLFPSDDAVNLMTRHARITKVVLFLFFWNFFFEIYFRYFLFTFFLFFFSLSVEWLIIPSSLRGWSSQQALWSGLHCLLAFPFFKNFDH